MDKEALNRKLAEWAGLFCEVRQRSLGENQYEAWFTPDRSRFLGGAPPDFTQSLDACFKWLVPKFKEFQDLTRTAKGWKVTYISGYVDSPKIGRYPIFDEVDAETPALVLCLAIEKLIDAV